MPFPATNPPLARALAERNYEHPTPVQLAVLADEAVDRDLLVSAQTGSGKTVAYGLAIATNLLDGAERFERAAAPLALIVAPTRELALQVQRELAWLYQHANARVVSCVGGMDPRREQRELEAGAHIVVGTPGRLCDHLRRGRLDISELKAVVLDEADEMLNLGFREDMEFILETTPETRRTLLFSATFPRGIVALAKQYQDDAFRIEVEGDEGGHADIEYRAIRIAPGDAEHAVVNVLRFYESPSAIVFCNTREAVRHLQAALLERGFSVVALSGELTQNERTTALQSLRDGRSRVCVATDVAARGIDLANLDLVIHAELPNDPEVMQHRSGRTGRAGRKGVSVLLVPPARRRRAETLLNLAGIEAVWGVAPQAEEIRKLDQERMLHDQVFTEETTAEDLALAQALLAERSPEDIAAALARLYRARLPSPEDILDAVEDRGRARPERGRDAVARGGRDTVARGEDRAPAPRTKGGKPSRHGMGEPSVWFRAAIGRRKKAEARWLLPMICRRGGIDKQDIGAIKISDTTTEFEIAARVADAFAANIRRPDKEDTIRIEPLAAVPTEPAASEPRPDKRPPRRDAEPRQRAEESAYHPLHRDEPRRDKEAPLRSRPHRDAPSKSGHAQPFTKKKQHGDKSSRGGQAFPSHSPRSKAPGGKKPKTKRRG
ncbi:DEAD/DEAH box helicase [Bradyrhizobium sp. 83012]|uniref:DEAD/DEAH box helicase n=1 Tax=Bradyrhizobium aeschynomenes TaxID=2734909 RepID=A0ABX2C625_9BRAD|nr:DEAD/DEAH box helicase [Bradyrhizobium aeschynomenes]NPU63736.1 DEAD/DEAH box helicase [Bradyrhizobium aeschynomenes]